MALRGIIGQERALRIFFGTLRRNRVPSAVLISGDMGIGKRLAAMNYVKAINCLAPADFDCCDECPSCRKIDAGMHPDITVLLPEGDEIKIDSIRKVEEVLFLKPFEGRKKAVIIDDADEMNINAANAFLKTLEEPPPDSLIILITSNPDRLPDTIRSRCMGIRFYPLPLEGCRELVSGGVKAEDLELVLRLSMGRPGLALSDDFKAGREWFMRLLDTMLRGESREVWEDKAAMKSWLDMAFVFLRDMVVFAVTGDESALIYPGAGKGAYKNVKPQAVFEAWQNLQKLRGLLDFNLNKSISWNYVSAIMQGLKI
ncbi:MAG TPA: DNA polymerase III subunit delta' [Dissulfurispiraceae bacterium]